MRSVFAVVPAMGCVALHLCAQPDWIRQWQQRTNRYTAQQPHWAGPVFCTVPMLVQVMREDALHQESGGAHLWNAGVSKGLQVVFLPRTEFTVTVPPYLERENGQGTGFGDVFGSVKFRIAARPEKSGNYILSALLNSTLPTGEGTNGAPAATLTPQLVGGKGWGRWNEVVSLAAALPVRDAARNGRVLTANSALQYHGAKYFWPEFETNTVTWFGSAHDGQVQTLIGPGFVVGRLPYVRGEKDRRRGISFGAGYLVAVTRARSYNHVFQITTRFHF